MNEMGRIQARGCIQGKMILLRTRNVTLREAAKIYTELQMVSSSVRPVLTEE